MLILAVYLKNVLKIIFNYLHKNIKNTSGEHPYFTRMDIKTRLRRIITF